MSRFWTLVFSVVLVLAIYSCHKDEVLQDLEPTIYHPEWAGHNPFEVTGTEYYIEVIPNDSGILFYDTLHMAHVYIEFDTQLLGPGQQYGARVDGRLYADIPNDGQFVHDRIVDTTQTDYCSIIEFLDQVLRPVHEYEMCYSVEF